MRAIIGSIGTLLVSAAVLLSGGGLLGTLIAVRAQLEGFPIVAIGLMTSAYSAGFVIGCLGTPFLVRRVGHIRVFSALSSLIAAAVLVHALFINVPVWIVLRIVAGFSFAGLYMLIESWINERSDNKNRGQVLSIYRMVDLVAVTAGQFLLTLSDPGGFALFSLVAILICLSIPPISMTKAEAPNPVANTSLNLKKLLHVAPLGVMGAIGVGLANGAFWGVAPVFVQQLGHSISIVPVFMTVVIVCGALFQWPVGALSDRLGRRFLLIVCAVGGAGGGVFLFGYASTSLGHLLVGGALYGAFGFQLFSLSAAHANDYAKPDEFVTVSGGLLLLYGVGSVIGPLLAPIVMSLTSPQSLFAFTAVVHIVLAAYGAYRRTQRDPAEDTDNYIAVPRTTPAVFRFDPRSLRKTKRKKPRVRSDISE